LQPQKKAERALSYEPRDFFPKLVVDAEIKNAGVVKLVDIPDLGSGAARHGGSSPSTRTNTTKFRRFKKFKKFNRFFRQPGSLTFSMALLKQAF
jgi:hypothetical protein